MKRLSVHTHTPTYPPKHPPSPPKKLEIIKDIFLSSLEDYLHLTAQYFSAREFSKLIKAV
jgi:hypothetical protein